MTFGKSISTCFSKYAEFSGRASRSEYWWWALFVFLGSAITGVISQVLSAVFTLAILLPHLAAGARRLHDTDRSAWLLLLGLIPLIGWIVLLVFFVQESKEPNRFASAGETT